MSSFNSYTNGNHKSTREIKPNTSKIQNPSTFLNSPPSGQSFSLPSIRGGGSGSHTDYETHHHPIDAESILTEFLTLVAEPHCRIIEASTFYNSKIKLAAESIALQHTRKHPRADLIQTSPEAITYCERAINLALISSSAAGNLEIVKWLIQSHNADVTYQNEDNCGLTALMAACDVGSLEVADYLLCNSADPNQQTFSASFLLNLSQGDSPLLISAFRGFPEVVTLLLQYDCNVNAKNADGSTALAFLAYHGDTSSMLKLISKGANVNAASEDGFTPLMLAARNGHASATSLLLRAGASVDMCNRGGFTAFMAACQAGHDPIEDEIGEEGHVNYDDGDDDNDDETQQPWRMASIRRHSRNQIASSTLKRIETIRILLSQGASLSRSSNRGSNCLHLAAASGRLCFVDELLNLIVPSSPLKEFAMSRQIASVVFARDDSGARPVDIARSKGHLKIEERLTMCMHSFLEYFSPPSNKFDSYHLDEEHSQELRSSDEKDEEEHTQFEGLNVHHKENVLYNFNGFPMKGDDSGDALAALVDDPPIRQRASNKSPPSNKEDLVQMMQRARLEAEGAIREMSTKYNLPQRTTPEIHQPYAFPPSRQELGIDTSLPEESKGRLPKSSRLHKQEQHATEEWLDGGGGEGAFNPTDEVIHDKPLTSQQKSKKQSDEPDEELENMRKRSEELFKQRQREEELQAMRLREQKMKKDEAAKVAAAALAVQKNDFKGAKFESYDKWFGDVSTTNLKNTQHSGNVTHNQHYTPDEAHQTVHDLNSRGSFIRSVYDDLKRAETLAASGKLGMRRNSSAHSNVNRNSSARVQGGAFSPDFAAFLTRLNSTKGSSNNHTTHSRSHTSDLEETFHGKAPLIVRMLTRLHEILPLESTHSSRPYAFAEKLTAKSSTHEVKIAYLEALKVIHPDKQSTFSFPGETQEMRNHRVSNAERVFQQLRDAYRLYSSSSQ